MNILIAPITPDDYQSAIKVIQRSISISQGSIYSKILTDELCKIYDYDNFLKKTKEIEYFVAKVNETTEVVGIIGLKMNDNRLRSFFVDPAMQGKGIGRMLYEHLEKIARKKGIKKLVLEGSPLGEPVYKKFGFKKIRTIYKEKAGIPYTDAYMEKILE